MRRLGSSLGVSAVSATGLLLLALAAPSPLSGQQGRREVESGNRLYEQGRYGEAHAKYLEALRKVPGMPLVRFNEGNALYQSQEFQRALEAYMDAAGGGDPALESEAWYNLGNTLLRQQQLEAAVDAYKEALRRNPSDGDAKHNLERALEMLQQDQSQEGQQDQDQQQDRDDEQEQDPQDDSGSGDSPQESEDGGQPPQNQGENPDEQREEPRNPENEGQQPPPEGERQDPQPQDGQGGMSPEEAERLLQAIQEDPGEVNRQAAQPRGRRPRKDW